MATSKLRGKWNTTEGYQVNGTDVIGSDGNVSAAVTLPEYTVATVPDAAGNEGQIIYVSNGNAGNPTVAVSDGTNWLNLVAGTAVAAA